jgi:predicted RNase H-like HicB family nuclease
MTETISLDVNLKAYVRRETSRRWVATCPLIGVASQATTAAAAKDCLQEAVELWFESCIERGVLDQALREVNFQPSISQTPRPRSSRGNSSPKPRTEVLGEAFAVHLTIPGYEAHSLLGATA